MKEKVTREFFEKHFSPGFCLVCEHYDSDKGECKIEDEAKYKTNLTARKFGYDERDTESMDCVLWEYKYTTE